MTIYDKTTHGKLTFDLWRQRTNLVAKEQGDLEYLKQEIKDDISSTTQDYDLTIQSAGDIISRKSGESFKNALQVSQTIVADAQTKTIINIISDDTAQVDSAFTSDLTVDTAAVSTTVTPSNLVSAINAIINVTENKDRHMLIRAIAMS